MDVLRQLNDAVRYIEDNLCAELDFEKAARRACISEDSFQRFFSYMTGMTLTEYVRRRRLTLAAAELRQGRETVLAVAVKYGYGSAEAFSRAFARQHGITPGAYRRQGGAVKVFPPASFHIVIKRAKEMDFRLIQIEDTPVYGLSRQFDGEGYATREGLRHLMWASDCDDVPGQLSGAAWNQPGCSAMDGVWYGLWQDGQYMIAREEQDIHGDALVDRRVIPGGCYAAFRTPRGAVAWEEFPKLFALIFDSWLPSSGFRRREALAIEVLHLWTDREKRQRERYFEAWVPVEPR